MEHGGRSTDGREGFAGGSGNTVGMQIPSKHSGKSFVQEKKNKKGNLVLELWKCFMFPPHTLSTEVGEVTAVS